MDKRYIAYLRACVGIRNLYGIVLSYWICQRGAEAVPGQGRVIYSDDARSGY